MTITVGWVGNGRQFTANIGSDTVTVVKYRGSGGTPSAAAADGSKEGATALTVTVNKTGIALFVTLPSALDFTGTEANEYVYVWGKFLAASILANVGDVDGGFGVCMSSGTPTASNYSLFSQYGADRPPKDWVRMVQDPTKTRSAGAGTLTTSNITHIGVFANVGTTTARFDNLLLDACDVGTGLKVTGTSTVGLIEELLADEATNAYGVVVPLNDSESATELSGELILGDDTGVLATTINDEDSKVFASEPLYYNSGLVAAVPLSFTNISCVGNGTGDTTITFGQAVGTLQGRNGISIVGNPTYDFGFDRDDGNVEAADLFGCSLENLTGTINLDGTHDFKGNTVSGCGAMSIASDAHSMTHVASGQMTLTGGANLIDPLVINNTGSSSVVTDDLAEVLGDFTSDGSNHAIELTSVGAGTMSFNNQLSGYETGVSGSPVTPTSTGNEAVYVNVASGTLTINVASGASTPSIRSAGATVNVVIAPVTLNIDVIDENTKAVITDARVHVIASGGGTLPDGTVIIDAALVNGSGRASGTAAGGQEFVGLVVDADTPAIHVAKPISGTIPSGGLTLQVSLVLDE